MTDNQRAQLCKDIAGKKIKSLYWEKADGGYWIMTFTDDSEICWNRTMAEIYMLKNDPETPEVSK